MGEEASYSETTSDSDEAASANRDGDSKGASSSSGESSSRDSSSSAGSESSSSDSESSSGGDSSSNNASLSKASIPSNVSFANRSVASDSLSTKKRKRVQVEELEEPEPNAVTTAVLANDVDSDKQDVSEFSSEAREAIEKAMLSVILSPDGSGAPEAMARLQESGAPCEMHDIVDAVRKAKERHIGCSDIGKSCKNLPQLVSPETRPEHSSEGNHSQTMTHQPQSAITNMGELHRSSSSSSSSSDDDSSVSSSSSSSSSSDTSSSNDSNSKEGVKGKILSHEEMDILATAYLEDVDQAEEKSIATEEDGGAAENLTASLALGDAENNEESDAHMKIFSEKIAKRLQKYACR